MTDGVSCDTPAVDFVVRDIALLRTCNLEYFFCLKFHESAKLLLNTINMWNSLMKLIILHCW
jgi:hypothetical protein